MVKKNKNEKWKWAIAPLRQVTNTQCHTFHHIYLLFVRSVDLCAPAFIKNKRYYIIAVSFNCESFRLNNFQYDFSDVNFDRTKNQSIWRHVWFIEINAIFMKEIEFIYLFSDLFCAVVIVIVLFFLDKLLK